jgi:hypothetical protein
MRFVPIAAFLLAAAIPCLADLSPTTLDKPLPAQVTVAEGNERLAGSLLRYDADEFTLKTGKGERTLKWSQLTGPTMYALRSQLIDKKSAGDWLELGEIAMRNDLKVQARAAVAQAVRLDASVRLKGDAILRGQGAAKPLSPGGKASTTDATGEGVLRFQKPTPEQEAKAMADARKGAAERGRELKIAFHEFETPHFLVFTDWAGDQHHFLKENLEGAYGAVARQFEIPVTENVFVGKLPVYMMDNPAEFKRFTLADSGPAGSAGYYRGWSDGHGYMVMSKPDIRTWGQQAPVVWARILTHEFTHAFLARYRNNRHVPRWLNEGIAEVIAYGQFPSPGPYDRAFDMAAKDFDFLEVFDPKSPVNFSLYPVYHTITEALAREDRKAFLAMFNDIKEGVEPEEALTKHFKVKSFAGMEEPWRNYVKNRRGQRRN